MNSVNSLMNIIHYNRALNLKHAIILCTHTSLTCTEKKTTNAQEYLTKTKGTCLKRVIMLSVPRTLKGRRHVDDLLSSEGRERRTQQVLNDNVWHLWVRRWCLSELVIGLEEGRPGVGFTWTHLYRKINSSRLWRTHKQAALWLAS